MKPLRTVREKNNLRLLEYDPTLFRLLYVDFEPMRFIRRMRFISEYIRKERYKVYYLEAGGHLVGHCVVTPGGRRLKCSSKKDIVLGPYYVKENERGKGYSIEMIAMVLEYCSFENAYDWVDKKNTASRKASEACGFVPVAELDVKKPFRKLVIVDHGEDIVYRYRKDDRRVED